MSNFGGIINIIDKKSECSIFLWNEFDMLNNDTRQFIIHLLALKK